MLRNTEQKNNNNFIISFMSCNEHKLRLNVYCGCHGWCCRSSDDGLQSVKWYFRDSVPCPLARSLDSKPIRQTMHRIFASQFPLIDARPPTAAVQVSYWALCFPIRPCAGVRVIALFHLRAPRESRAMG